MTADRIPLRVAFQGEIGSFSDEAIQQLWGGDAERFACRTFADVTAAVAAGAADRGMLPIENTIAGSIGGAHDAIVATPGLRVIGETVIAVHHCVLGLAGATIDAVRTVLCHPVALDQCRKFFVQQPQMTVQPSYDTAGAAMEVSQLSNPEVAAVASRRAALLYGLQILRADIEDRSDNQTRFLAIARTPRPLPAGTPARTMLVARTTATPGSLLSAVGPLAKHGVSIRRLESRPTGEPWSYWLFAEFDHHVGDTAADAVVNDIARRATETRMLGTYPCWEAGVR